MRKLSVCDRLFWYSALFLWTIYKYQRRRANKVIKSTIHCKIALHLQTERKISNASVLSRIRLRSRRSWRHRRPSIQNLSIPNLPRVFLCKSGGEGSATPGSGGAATRQIRHPALHPTSVDGSAAFGFHRRPRHCVQLPSMTALFSDSVDDGGTAFDFHRWRPPARTTTVDAYPRSILICFIIFFETMKIADTYGICIGPCPIRIRGFFFDVSR